jgi:hypothetical protein
MNLINLKLKNFKDLKQCLLSQIYIIIKLKEYFKINYYLFLI